VALQWLGPLAALGAFALIVPLLVHLFSRRPPDVVPFPSLQLLRTAALRPTRRARLADIGLLMLRMAVLAVVVLALMQPAWLNSSAESSRQPTVLVLRDTMALRSAVAADAGAVPTEPSGENRLGNRAGERRTTRLVATTQLRDALPSAVAWLRSRQAPRVLEVHSTFPVWALDSADIDALPSDITVRLTVVPPDSGLLPGTAQRPTMPADSLPWPPGDSAAAWWNVLAFWRIAAEGERTRRWWHWTPLDSARAERPVLFNADGEPVVAAVWNADGLGLSNAAFSAEMAPQWRLDHTAAPVPQRSDYHAAGTLAAWARQTDGAALGSAPSRDVHEQDTLARWLWGLALVLLLLEQFIRRRGKP